jgi:hypothetical protein
MLQKTMLHNKANVQFCHRRREVANCAAVNLEISGFGSYKPEVCELSVPRCLLHGAPITKMAAVETLWAVMGEEMIAFFRDLLLSVDFTAEMLSLRFLLRLRVMSAHNVVLFSDGTYTDITVLDDLVLLQRSRNNT